MTTYYPEYVPKNQNRFERMLAVFGTAESKDHLEKLMLCYVLDMSYDREDILVAHGRIERERGWK